MHPGPECDVPLSEVHCRLGDLERLNGNFARAVEEYGSALELRKQVCESTDRLLVDVHYSLAVAHIYEGGWEMWTVHACLWMHECCLPFAVRPLLICHPFSSPLPHSSHINLTPPHSTSPHSTPQPPTCPPPKKNAPTRRAP